MKKTTQLRRLLFSNELSFLMEAHSGLSAKIVQEANFKGIWASGLAIAASLGVRDNNEASWTQVLEVAEFMSDATTIPIMLDADTGYGNFNNVRRLVRKLEQRDIAAVCIEDKLFPKINSYIGSEKQPLADVKEFCGKIKAAKDTQQDPDLSVLARVEAFVAGWGLGEALQRAEAYHNAGADAILIHSKMPKPDEILAFMREWEDRCPVVVVPTTYYSTPTRVFEEAGISMVIWANHLIRSSIASMQRVAQKLSEERSLLTVEDEIVPVKEVFRLQAADELRRAERAYLPFRDLKSRAVIMAASRGSELGSLTGHRPKAMLSIKGRPLLQRLVDHLNEVGIKDILVIAGYKPDSINVTGIKLAINKEYAETKELYSLYLAKEYLETQTIVSYGDILFKKYILLNLLNEVADIVIAVDASHSRTQRPPRYTEFVRCSRPFSMDYFEEPVLLKEMDPDLHPSEANGEWIGLMKLSSEGVKRVREALVEFSTRDDFKQLRLKDLFQHLLQKNERIHVLYVSGHWLDIDNLEALSRAVEF
ncbi:phosphoenolpyruvate mutase [Acidobacteria bacterium AH-259-D05]|nr:phosphoenolpyruvate mutase [Acidobacteria bacterium AH-259-D05]